jgi:UDP-glucose 4-epimerase
VLQSSFTTCVIGGSGFIGRAVVDALLARNRRVIVVGRSPLASPLPAEVTYVINADSRHSAPLREALNQVDEVINLAYATIPQTSFQHPVDDIVLNLPEAVALFELCSTLAIRKFVGVSSGGTVYGRTLQGPVNEDYPTLPLSPYGITKLAIEKYAHMYFENRGLPAVAVRPSNAFGARQRPYVGQGFIGTAIASIIDGKTINLFGEQGTIRDYLYVKDMAEGIVSALVDGVVGEVYNIGSGIGLTNKQVLDAIRPLAHQAGYDIKLNILPSRPFDVPVNILDSKKLHQATGWSPATPFSDAIAETWDWYMHKSAEKRR